MFKSFTDWAAATFFTPEDEVQMHKDVAAAQQAILDRQYAEGKRGMFEYWGLSSDIKDAGSYQADFVAENSGLGGFLKSIPWWVYLAGAVALFVWLGGLVWLKGILARRAKA